MDPAFSLADELAELHHTHDQGYEDDEFGQLDHHNEREHEYEYELHQGTEFGAEMGYGPLDAELEALHLHTHAGHDLASELDAGARGGSLAAELDPNFAEGGSLADELDTNGLSGVASPSYTSSETPATATASSALSMLTASSCTAEVQESIQATRRFLSHLSCLSASATVGTSSAAAGEAAGEDTAQLEQAAARYLKFMSECTAEREAQLRELRELDRRLARDFTDTAAGMGSSRSFGSDLALASRTLSDLDEEDDSHTFARLESPTTTTHSTHRATASLSSDSTITDFHPHPLSSAYPTLPLDPALFQPLYTTTTSLVASLNSLHEQTQITKSSTADANRKLKTLKGLIAQWKQEQQSLESSEAWIQHHSQSDPESFLSPGSSRQTWLNEQIDWCTNRLQQVEGRARELLTPVSIVT